MTTIDPLGLRRCAYCSNAFVYDAEPAVTERLRRDGALGPKDFICHWCAARLRDRLGTDLHRDRLGTDLHRDRLGTDLHRDIIRGTDLRRG
jgi:hypothetical protein